MTATTVRAANVDITPHGALPLFGRVGRTVAADRTVSRLEANCLLIVDADGDIAALVAIDSLYPSQSLSDVVLHECAAQGLLLEPDALLFVASHTHNAPALDETKPKLGQLDEGYLLYVAGQIAACLWTLWNTAGATTHIAVGKAKCHGSVFRRRRVKGIDTSLRQSSARTVMAPDGRIEIDQDLKLLFCSSSNNTPSVVLWTWPCHATSQPDPASVGADFPGAVRRYIRETFNDPSLPVLYLPGFSGDIRPASTSLIPVHRSNSWFGIGPRFGRASAKKAAALHDQLYCSFDAAVDVLDDCGPVSEMRLTREKRTLALEDIRTEAAKLAPLTCLDWKLGPLIIKAVSAEVSSGYADAAGASDALSFVTGCAGQVFGYLPTDSQLPEGGYEVDGFAPLFSIPGTFHPAIEAKIARLIGT